MLKFCRLHSLYMHLRTRRVSQHQAGQGQWSFRVHTHTHRCVQPAAGCSANDAHSHRCQNDWRVSGRGHQSNR
eukprot:32427-Eustigmatos_ZCMA.PRE.1